jgi:hypothetical protein
MQKNVDAARNDNGSHNKAPPSVSIRVELKYCNQTNQTPACVLLYAPHLQLCQHLLHLWHRARAVHQLANLTAAAAAAEAQP